LETSVLPRDATLEAAVHDIMTAALWTHAPCPERQIRVNLRKRQQLEIKFLQQQYINAVVLDHLTPRLEVTVYAAFPETEVSFDFVAEAKLFTEVVKFV
jgi:hypothetical protein